MVKIRQNWMDRFLERHTDTLNSVWGTSQTTLRGGAADPETIDHWFSLSETIAKFSIVPELIFAMDETCCFIEINKVFQGYRMPQTACTDSTQG